METLHVLNGDSSLAQFNKTELEGATFVWREILCEGTTKKDLTSDAFWETRLKFLQKIVPDFDPEQQQQLKVQFQNLNLSNYKEIVLWFEYDLFCQVNLIALLSWIYNLNTTTKVSLICLGEHPNYQKLVGLGEINSNEFAALYPQRILLEDIDLAFADNIWKIYCSDKQEHLLTTIAQSKTPKFKHLEKAFLKHQHRFPNLQNGLTEIESKMMALMVKTPKSKNQLIGEMLRGQEYYGFGDLQYFNFLADLNPLLIEREGKLYVNELGAKVLNNEIDFQVLRKEINQYGGVDLNQYRWDEAQNKLVK